MKEKKMIETKADFIAIRRYNYSLKKLLERYPDGAPPSVRASALGMTIEEEEELFKSIAKRLKEDLEKE